MKMKKLSIFVAVIVAALTLFSFVSALADSASVNFEPPAYVVGSPNGQDGWVALGSAGSDLTDRLARRS